MDTLEKIQVCIEITVYNIIDITCNIIEWFGCHVILCLVDVSLHATGTAVNSPECSYNQLFMLS